MSSVSRTLFIVFWLAGVAGFVALVVFTLRGNAKEKAAFKRAALAQFGDWQTSQAASQLHLRQGECEVVQETETVGRVRNGPIFSYTLTRFMRNANGDYYMFKSTPSGPYVKPVAQEVARAALKEKYVEQRSA